MVLIELLGWLYELDLRGRSVVCLTVPELQETWFQSDPWVRKIPWRRKWQPTPVFLPKMSWGERSLVGYSPWGCKRVRHDDYRAENSMNNLCHVPSTAPNRRLAFNEMVALKKKCVFAPGGEIHTSAEGSWLASKEYFSLSRVCSAWYSALLELCLSDTFLNHLSSWCLVCQDYYSRFPWGWGRAAFCNTEIKARVFSTVKLS